MPPSTSSHIREVGTDRLAFGNPAPHPHPPARRFSCVVELVEFGGRGHATATFSNLPCTAPCQVEGSLQIGFCIRRDG